MTAALEDGEWSTPRPGRTLPPGKTRYPLYRRLGGPQGRCGQAENLVPTGIRSRTIQPVAQSLYRLSYRAHIYIKIWYVKLHVQGNFARSCKTLMCLRLSYRAHIYIKIWYVKLHVKGNFARSCKVLMCLRVKRANSAVRCHCLNWIPLR
jgi:hypothetical protein